MGHYKQEQVQGWQRARTVFIDNPYGEVPSITFNEEMIVTDNNIPIFASPVGSCAISLQDPATGFNLLNPNTDEVIGTAHFQDAYIMLYSLYKKLADDRDAGLIP